MPETNIYDYEFTVNESEPKRADMLNRLKDRVRHVDKKEIISSDEFIDGESNFSEDKALSAFLLYKLFPTKVNLLKEHYNNSQGRWVYETNKNAIEASMFIKNGYICIRYGFRNRPEVERNLVDVGKNFDLGIYIIS